MTTTNSKQLASEQAKEQAEERSTKLQYYREKAGEDSKINSTQLGEESLNIPILHNRWLKYLQDEKIVLLQHQTRYAQKYKKRWEYYRGFGTDKDYSENPFHLKLNKTEIDVYLEADKELTQLRVVLKIQERIVEFIEKTLDQIVQRNWHIRNAIEYLKFMNGVV